MLSDTVVHFSVSAAEEEPSAKDTSKEKKANEKEKSPVPDEVKLQEAKEKEKSLVPDEVKLQAIDSKATLEWPVRICSKKGLSNVFLQTPKGNVRSDKDGKFGNNGGGGIWAQWEKSDADGGLISF